MRDFGLNGNYFGLGGQNKAKAKQKKDILEKENLELPVEKTEVVKDVKVSEETLEAKKETPSLMDDLESMSRLRFPIADRALVADRKFILSDFVINNQVETIKTNIDNVDKPEPSKEEPAISEELPEPLGNEEADKILDMAKDLENEMVDSQPRFVTPPQTIPSMEPPEGFGEPVITTETNQYGQTFVTETYTKPNGEKFVKRTCYENGRLSSINTYHSGYHNNSHMLFSSATLTFTTLGNAYYTEYGNVSDGNGGYVEYEMSSSYDQNGKFTGASVAEGISSWRFNSDDPDQRIKSDVHKGNKWVYDADGNCIEGTHRVSSDDGITVYESHSWENSAGKFKEEEITTPDGESIIITTTYDDNDNVSSIVIETSGRTITCDKDGNIIKTETKEFYYDEENDALTIHTVEYDANGNLVKDEVYYSYMKDGIRTSCSEETRYDENGNVIGYDLEYHESENNHITASYTRRYSKEAPVYNYENFHIPGKGVSVTKRYNGNDILESAQFTYNDENGYLQIVKINFNSDGTIHNIEDTGNACPEELLNVVLENLNYIPDFKKPNT